MARSSDIEFGKLALVLGFTQKEDVYSAIRETALLQEMGILKRLPHIMYERGYLTAVQIQTILWALFKSRKIKRFPSRVVYEFTEEDDKQFLEKAVSSVEKFFSDLKSSALIKKRNKNKIGDSPFPQDVLIYCLDLQKQLKNKGFSRSLLSILSAKGYLQNEQRNLVPEIEKKKIILSRPSQAKDKSNRRRWEGILFSAWAIQKQKINQKQVDKALAVWEQAQEQFRIAIKFSEILNYLGYMTKSDLTKLGIFIAEFANLDQVPGFHLFELKDEEKDFFHSQLRQEKKYQKAYHKCLEISEKLAKSGLKIPPEELLIHKGYLTKVKLKEKMERAKFQKEDGKRRQAFDLVSTAEYKLVRNLSRRFARKQESDLSKKQKRDLATKMIPFSVDSLEKEFETRYLEERKAQRSRRPEEEIRSIITEWSQTQILPFQEIDFSPTEDTALTGSQIRNKWRPKSADEMEAKEHTEYISLGEMQEKQEGQLSPREIEQTGYISLDASIEDITEYSQSIVQNVESQKSSGAMLLAMFVVAAGIALVEPKFRYLFGDIKALPIYTGLSMFVVYLPSLFLGEWFGTIADKGKVHKLYFWGFLIYAISLVPVPFFRDIYSHCAIRFIQGIGLGAIAVAAEYCVGRWYGPLERGRIMGLVMMVFTLGFCLGFLLPDMFMFTEEMKIPSLLSSSIFWAIIVLLMIPATRKIRVAAAISEDEEEEEEIAKPVIDKKPLIAAALYGITETGLFAVFFPCFPTNSPFGGGEVSSELLITFFGIGAFFSSYTLGWLSDRVGAIPILTFLSLLAISSFFALSLPFIDATMAQMLFFAIGVTVGGLSPLGFSWLLETTDDERHIGAAAGAFAMFQGAGSMLGCLLCGVAFYAFHVNGFLLMLSMVFIGYFYLLVNSTQRNRSTNDSKKFRGLLSLLEPTEP